MVPQSIIQGTEWGLSPFITKAERGQTPRNSYYAIADGLKWLFVSHGKWRGPSERFDGKGDLQMELEFADG